MNKVVVVGASVVDVLMKSTELRVLKSHEVPGGVAMAQVMGGKIEAEKMGICSGGGGSNVAVGLKKLGESVKMISRIGHDFMGELLEKEFAGYQLDMELLQRGEGATGVSTVLVNNSGGRSIVTFRGESMRINSAQIDWETLKKADWLQISSLGGKMDLLFDLVDFCFECGVKIGINPGKVELGSSDFKRILPKVDFLSLNRAEASVLSGVPFDNEEGILQKLSSSGVRCLAVTDGKRGGSLVRSGNWIKMNTFSNGSVDDTGAGDAFVCGVVSGILNNKSDIEILKRGLANGSSVVTKIGAKAGLLSKDEMEKWANKKLKTVESLLG